MKLARIWILAGFVLASGAVRLLADTIPDPTMTFNVPGHHSFDLSHCDGSSPCFFLAGVIDNNGFATTDFDIKNDTDMVVQELKFFIPTDNFDQIFVAHTNTFTTAAITFDQTGEAPVTIVDFFGIGNQQVNGGSASAFGCSDDECYDTTGQAGFAPNQPVEGEAFFVTDAPPTYPGLQPGADGSLDLTPNVPEPGTFVLLLSAAGVLAVGRKFRRR
jgi:hypothetical protein